MQARNGALFVSAYLVLCNFSSGTCSLIGKMIFMRFSRVVVEGAKRFTLRHATVWSAVLSCATLEEDENFCKFCNMKRSGTNIIYYPTT